LRTQSNAWMVVTNMPISSTVPVTPPAVMKSPTLNGRKTCRNTPAAKLLSMPLQAAPMATPAPARRAAKLAVWMPKKPRIATTRMTRRTAPRMLIR